MESEVETGRREETLISSTERMNRNVISTLAWVILEAETNACLAMTGFLSLDRKTRHGLEIDQRRLHNTPTRRSGYVHLKMQSLLTRYASSWSANCRRTVISSS